MTEHNKSEEIADWECPGEAHELDNTFNPSFQGPYGPGYHDCDICDNEGFVTKEVYDEEIAFQKAYAEKRARWGEEKKTIDAIMRSKQNYIAD